MESIVFTEDRVRIDAIAASGEGCESEKASKHKATTVGGREGVTRPRIEARAPHSLTNQSQIIDGQINVSVLPSCLVHCTRVPSLLRL